MNKDSKVSIIKSVFLFILIQAFLRKAMLFLNLRAFDKRGCFIENGSYKETSVHNQKEKAEIFGTDNDEEDVRN